MKLIRHIIPVDIDKNQKLIINSLNGLMDKVDANVFELLTKWRSCNEIIPVGEFETGIYNSLMTRGYLTESQEAENAIKQKIIEKLRAYHKSNASKCNHITFVMTYNCNFRCHYCFEGKSNVKKEVITPEQIDAALALSGGDLLTVGLFGGEPLLPATRTSLEYLISKTYNKQFNITTNGYYLEEFFDLLSPLKFSSIMVTLDGDEKSHNSRRYLANGKPTYQKIMQGIQKYLENRMPICIRMNVDKSNIKSVQNIKASLIQRFNKYKEFLTFELSPMLDATHEERTQVHKQLYSNDVGFSNEEKQQRNRMLGKFRPIVNAISVGSRVRPTYSTCHAHYGNSILVDPFGLIYPCLVAVGKEELAVGTYYPEVNYKENSIFTRNIETIPECSNCVYSLLCGGGCPLSLPSYQNVCKPACASIRNQIHNILPQLYQMNNSAEAVSV